MSRIKKLLIVVLTVIIVSTTGCSSWFEISSLEHKTPETITLWHYYSGETKLAFDDLVNEFNGTIGIEKGIVINAIPKGGVVELEAELTNSAKGVVNAEEMPDIFTVYDDKLVELDSYGKVCDLNQYFSEEDKVKYVNDFIHESTDNRLLSIPTVKCTEVFFANKIELDKFLVETGFNYENVKTWEDYFELSQSYYNWSDGKTPDIFFDGKSFMGIDSVANYIIATNKQLGVNIIDSHEGQVTLDKEALNRIFDIYYKGISLGYFNAVGAFRSDDVKAGDLVAYVGSTTSVAYFPTSIKSDFETKDFELLVNYYPVFEGGQSYAIQQGAGMSVANSTPEKQEAAALFLKWFTEPSQNLDFALATGYLPVQKESINIEYKSGDQIDEKIINMETVYNLSRNQILNENTYTAEGFKNSYDVRNILGNFLVKQGEIGRKKVAKFRSEGLTETEIINRLNENEAFEEWLNLLETEFTKLGINYIIN